jgi:hypothetical protein
MPEQPGGGPERPPLTTVIKGMVRPAQDFLAYQGSLLIADRERWPLATPRGLARIRLPRLWVMPNHRQRATVHETRIALIAIGLASIALLLVLVTYVAGLLNRVVVEYVHDDARAGIVASGSIHFKLG